MRQPIAALSAAVPVLASLVLAACGSGQQTDSTGDFQGEERLVAQAIERFETASLENEPATICEEVLTRELASTVGGGDPARGCARRVGQVLDDADTFALTVEDVTVTGTTATTRVEQRRDGRDKLVAVQLEKDGRTWRIAALPGR